MEQVIRKIQNKQNQMEQTIGEIEMSLFQNKRTLNRTSDQ